MVFTQGFLRRADGGIEYAASFLCGKKRATEYEYMPLNVDGIQPCPVPTPPNKTNDVFLR
jgi:hypothetical protein